jgi:serralysin
MPGITSVARSFNQDIDGLLSGIKWAVSSLTFSFPSSASFYQAGSAPYGETSSFAPLNATQQNEVRWVLQQFASVALMSFTEITETSSQHADLRAAGSNAPSTAWAYFPASSAYGGDSWYNRSSHNYDNPVRGNYAAHTFLHEFGHAFGLEHGHDTSNPYGALPAGHDSLEYSVMTYRTYVGGALSGYTYENWGAPQTLMQDDIAAIQYMYGANFNSNSGNTSYSWSPATGEEFVNGIGQGAPGSNRIFMTLWDGGGVDTYDFSNYATNLSVDLRPGRWTTVSAAQLADLGYWTTDGPGAHMAAGNIANALLYNNDPRSLIENAIGGSGSDLLVGNAANNLLDGRGGANTLMGATGNDSYVVRSAGDQVIENTGEGYDTITASMTYVLPANIEALVLASGAINGTGNNADNSIVGNSGNNAIDGGAGADVMTGGTGNDTYYVGSLGDQIVEFAGEGADWVYVSVSGYTIPVNVELAVVALAGLTLNAGAPNAALYGGLWDHVLYGSNGGDFLNGGSGGEAFIPNAGADAINGGSGTDAVGYTWVSPGVANTAAVLIDLTDVSRNTGIAAGDTYASIEIFYGSQAADWLGGDGAANTFYGNAGDDLVFGRDGADMLYGENGNDVLLGGAGADILDGGAGTDTVGYCWLAPGVLNTSAVTVNLATPAQNAGIAAGDSLNSIEVVYGSRSGDTLIGDANANNFHGDAGNDDIRGAAGNDTLFGEAGNDTLNGGIGNDVLSGSSGDDLFVFNKGDGLDTVSDFTAGNAAGDVIDLHGYGVATFAALQGFMTQVAADTLIAFDASNHITLQSVTLGQLNQSDFLLS